MPAFIRKDLTYLADRSIPEPNTGCWLWLLALDKDGYAMMAAPFTLAHRLAALLAHGPRPEGMEVDHKCRMRCCVNPDHVHYVTHAENMAAIGENHPNLRKTHCSNGHLLSGENVRLRVTKEAVRRVCVICKRESSAASYLKRKMEK